MSKKTFELTADLVVRSVNCPGVWLCPNGLVSLSFKTLDSKYRTSAVQPIFPLLYNTAFSFKKVFNNMSSPSKVHQCLAGEIVYCELLQWPNGYKNGKGRLLATYTGVLEDLLYPPATLCIGSQIDLLMKPAPIFPGILSPKIEIHKRVTKIDEVLEKRTSHRREGIRGDGAQRDGAQRDSARRGSARRGSARRGSSQPISISIITENDSSVHESSDRTTHSWSSSYREYQNCECVQREMLPKRQKPVCHSPRINNADYSGEGLNLDCNGRSKNSRSSTISDHHRLKCDVCSEYTSTFGKFSEPILK